MRGLIALGMLAMTAAVHAEPVKPNFIVIFTDDQGYADTGLYGARDFETPNLDQMAEEGLRFTNFYSMANACSPARAALLTGCYPLRVSIPNVLGPSKRAKGHATGLHPDELTIAELLKQAGYATGSVGKWHLGDIPEFLPTSQGFDTWFGLPYSNDMWPNHPTSKDYPDLPLMNDTEVVEWNPDMDTLTSRYTEKAVAFIQANKDRPFFLYLAHSMPHVPLGVSDAFRGKSKQGLYGDVIMEIDWSVGQVLGTLKSLGIDDNTMVVFTSDNGPWLSYGNHAGSAIPLREGKGSTWDGGHRVPCIVRWPGQIPPGQVCDTMVGNFDFFPTIAARAGLALPSDRAFDGKDIWPVLSAQASDSPHEMLFFYLQDQLQAVRKGPWKLHRNHEYRSLKDAPGADGIPGPYIQKTTPVALYNLETDIGELIDVSSAHPEVVQELQNAMNSFEARLLKEKRPAGEKDTTPSAGG